MIKDFGAQVNRVWEGLRPATKKMLVGAMQTNLASPIKKISYDAQSDWELSSLLFALDAQTQDSEVKKDSQKLRKIRQMARTVADVLESQSASAEVFIQLAERALTQRDYREIDKLTDALLARFAVSEMCEIVRQTENPAIRALGYETLALVDVTKLLPVLEDPLYEEIVRNVLEQQAFEYDNERARQILEQIEYEDETENI
jgi:hypothetical protein